MGLELSGPLGQAYLIPYKNRHTGQKEANFQVGYRGLIDLAYRSGRVDRFAPYLVRQGDHFKYRLGTDPRIEHSPNPDQTDYSDATITHVYSVVRIKGGTPDFEVMTVGEVNAHRDRYSRAKDNGPWVDAYAKRVPLSVELQRAALTDEYGEAGIQVQALSYEPQMPANFDKPASRTEELAERIRSEREQRGVQEAEVVSPPPPRATSAAGEDIDLRELVEDCEYQIGEANTPHDFTRVGGLLEAKRQALGVYYDPLSAKLKAKANPVAQSAPRRSAREI
jgi:recombination protein RecT